MQNWNKDLFFKYEPSIETYKLSLLVMEKMGKLSTRMSSVFVSHKMSSRIFTYIESKYSSKIEGIYTTLFDVVNTGIETKQQKLIKPLVDALFNEKQIINFKGISQIAKIMNSDQSQSRRYDNKFGVYEMKNNKRKKIYQPPLQKTQIDKLLRQFINKAKTDKNIIEMIHSHLIFEKIHPFIDANGRIGRLILQKQFAVVTNFSPVVPLSWAFFKNLGLYYQAFDIKTKQDLDKGVQIILNIFLSMYETTKRFLMELNAFKDKYLNKIKETSFKVTDEIASRILMTLQTKSVFLQSRFKLNPKTIDNIFEKINTIGLTFNTKTVNRKKAFWNLELEELVDKYYC